MPTIYRSRGSANVDVFPSRIITVGLTKSSFCMIRVRPTFGADFQWPWECRLHQGWIPLARGSPSQLTRCWIKKVMFQRRKLSDAGALNGHQEIFDLSGGMMGCASFFCLLWIKSVEPFWQIRKRLVKKYSLYQAWSSLLITPLATVGSEIKLIRTNDPLFNSGIELL